MFVCSGCNLSCHLRDWTIKRFKYLYVVLLHAVERSIASMKLSYRLEINDKMGNENCLALHCTRPTSYCTVKDYDCNMSLPYFCPNLHDIGNDTCPTSFQQYQRYKYSPRRFRSCYSKQKYTWQDAMRYNKCGGSNYTDFGAITEAAKDFIYLNSSSHYYWFGAGKYSCETGEMELHCCMVQLALLWVILSASIE